MVKLIGDEILYTAGDERSGCMIAFKLTETFADHNVIPPVRIGMAAGEVLLRDGDVFGPVVNLAARAVNVARQRSGVDYGRRATPRIWGIGGTGGPGLKAIRLLLSISKPACSMAASVSRLR